MDIKELMATSFKDALKVLTIDLKDKDDKIPDNRKAFEGEHAILDDPARRAKVVGDTPENSRIVKHAQETVPFQKRIVNSAVTFLFGKPVKLILNSEGGDAALELINSVWKQNKLDYFNKSISRALFIECKAAELWYIPPPKDNAPARIRVAMLSDSTGYKIYPHYDDYGDMDAFTVMYETKDEKGKIQANTTVYTADTIYRATKGSGEWVVEEVSNIAGKIPIVYYEQEEPEWESVKTQINRLEYLLSNFADTNDYFAAPALELKGIVTNLPKKEDTGKVFQVEPETDENGKVYYPGGIEFKAWANAPEAIKQEYDMLKDIIYGMTQTPDLSFQNVKGMAAISGIALRLMFSDALFKTLDKQEVFGPAMERRISIMKTLIGTTDVGMQKQLEEADIDVVFNDILPTDIEGIIGALSVARGGEPVMSAESAVRNNPLVVDAEKDIELLGGEKTALKSLGESYEA